MKGVILGSIACLLIASIPVSPVDAQVSLAQLSVTSKSVYVDIPGTRGLLMPETQMATIKFGFRVEVPQMAAGLVLYACPFAGVQIVFSAVRPADYATVMLFPQSKVLELSATRPTQDVDVMLFVVTSRVAPAFQPYTYSVKAQAFPTGSTACMVGQSMPARAEALIVNDYVPLLAASTPDWGSHAEPISVENRGNGATRVDFDWLLQDGSAVSSGRSLNLETRLEAATGTSGSVLLDRADAPKDWSGRIRVTGRSSIHPEGALTFVQDLAT